LDRYNRYIAKRRSNQCRPRTITFLTDVFAPCYTRFRRKNRKELIHLELGTGKMLSRQVDELRDLYNFDDFYTVDFDKSIKPDMVADCHNLPFRDSCISSARAAALLEHVLDPFEVMSEINRVLEDGGFVWVWIPFMWSEHRYPIDYYRFSGSGLDYLFSKAGFKMRLVEIDPYIGVFYTAAMVFTFNGDVNRCKSILVSTLVYFFAVFLNKLRIIDHLINCRSIYTAVVGTAVKDEGSPDEMDSKALAKLLFLWKTRPDIQKTFPEVLSLDCSNLIRLGHG